MRKKLTTLLLAACLTVAAAFTASAQTFNVLGCSITPPSYFVDQSADAAGVSCFYSNNTYEEELEYESGGSASQARRTAKREFRSYRRDGYQIINRVKSVSCNYGRVAYYFIVADYDPQSIEYVLVTCIPVGSVCIMCTDSVDMNSYGSSVIPFSTDTVRQLSDSIAATGTVTPTVPVTPVTPVTPTTPTNYTINSSAYYGAAG